MTYIDWEQSVPVEITSDALWRVEAYRLGLFLSDLVWEDTDVLMATRKLWSSSDQLFRAAGNISSNIAEGFSRSSPPDRARFFEYTFGSAREVRDWYFKVRRALPESVVDHRMKLVTQVIKLANTMINNERKRVGRIRKKADV